MINHLYSDEVERAAGNYMRYVAMTRGYRGCFGVGDSLLEAVEMMRRAGAKKKDDYKVYRFISHFPFAPADRDATDGEADAWVGADGSISWLRCERECWGEMKGD